MKKWAFILLFGLVACNTEKKALSKTQLYLFKHPEFSAGYCAEQFPDKPDSVIIKTDTIVEIAVMDSIVYDSIYLNVPGHVILGADTSSDVVYRTIYKTQKIYIKKDSIIYRENKAESQRLQLALNDCQYNNNTLLASNQDKDKLIAEWKGKARRRGWEFWGLIFLVIGAIGMKLYTKSKKINI